MGRVEPKKKTQRAQQLSDAYGVHLNANVCSIQFNRHKYNKHLVTHGHDHAHFFPQQGRAKIRSTCTQDAQRPTKTNYTRKQQTARTIINNKVLSLPSLLNQFLVLGLVDDVVHVALVGHLVLFQLGRGGGKAGAALTEGRQGCLLGLAGGHAVVYGRWLWSGQVQLEYGGGGFKKKLRGTSCAAFFSLSLCRSRCTTRYASDCSSCDKRLKEEYRPDELQLG